MSLISLPFLLIALAFIVLARLPWAGLRLYGVIGVNAIFVGLSLGGPESCLPLLAFAALGYGLIAAAARRVAPALLIGAAVIAFAVLKGYSVIPADWRLISPAQTIGLSYILFRVVHLVVDVSQGEVKRPRPAEYLAYLFFWLSFLSGPIQRFDEARRNWAEPAAELSDAQARRALLRITLGMAKLTIVSATVSDFIAKNVGLIAPAAFKGAIAKGSLILSLIDAANRIGPGPIHDQIGAATIYALIAILFTINLYFNFAGYMDIVLGVARLAGITLPENFDHPFRSRSLIEFWSRWHITLSDWFKTYLFNPLMSWLLSLPKPPGRIATGVIAFFVTFLAMGIWHGTTNAFVIYGVMLGGGVAATKLYQDTLTKRLGKKPAAALRSRPTYAFAGRVVTFSYFALALTCLWGADAGLLATLGWAGGVAAPLGMAAMVALGFAVLALIEAAAIRLPRPGVIGPALEHLAIGGLATLCLMVMAARSVAAPDLIYKGF